MAKRPGRWLKPGEAVEIGGFKIADGMLYVGGNLQVAGGGRNENCLIDPTLPVSRNTSDPSASTMPYWPAYSSIQPQARHSYLQWLAGGRSDPAVGIGYVFLFFYGLERRLFLDKGHDEGGFILDEVRRLVSIYGANHSFASYSAKLLEAATLSNETPRPDLSSASHNSYEIPLDVRRYLGARLAANEPLQSGDALLWLLALPDTSLRTPATRCFAEFKSIWNLRFNERQPKGLRIATPKTRLKARYRAASATFDVELPVGDLPDISAISAPIAGLRDLADACTEELNGYSRLLGRQPAARGSVEAASLLPPALWNAEFGGKLQAIQEALEAKLKGNNIITMSVSDICGLLDLARPIGDKLPPETFRQAGGILDRLDIAFEPDRRYGAVGPGLDSTVVMYRSPAGGRVDSEKPDYVLARTLVEVTTLAVVADNDVDVAEFESIQSDLRAIPSLSDAEQRRLLAYAVALLKDPPKQQSAFNRLAKLGERERARVVESAIAAVLADGRVTPTEVKFLERLYKALGLAQDDIYRALHRGSVKFDDVVVVSSEQRSPGVRISPALPEPGAAIVIDESRLARVRSETAAVSALLAGIFRDESPRPDSTQTEVPSAPSVLSGLDPPHASLLSSILASGGVPRDAFEDIAKKLRLLPDGAYELINEWGFETFDEPVLEGGEMIHVCEHLKAQIEHLRTAR
jgi:tellurite resistance protein